MAVTLASVDGTWTNSPTYDAGELRRADAAIFASAGISSGLTVSVDGADVVTVTAGQVVISGEDAVTGTGVYRAGTPVSVTGNLEARNATNPRIDLIVFRQYDTDVVGAHPRYASEIEIIAGTPSATPGVPTMPSMAVELARVTVPASGGGAASVDSSHRLDAATVAATVAADAKTVVVKSAGQSVTNSATPVSDTALRFAVVDGSSYVFEAHLLVSVAGGSSASDFRVGGSSPGGAFNLSGAGPEVAMASTASIAQGEWAGFIGGSAATLVYGLDSNGTTSIHVYGSVTPTASGTFALTWAQNVATAVATTVNAGSWLRAEKATA